MRKSNRLVDDEFWARIAPLIPKPRGRMGRPRLSDRAALAGILFVLRSGIPWQMLPKEMGCGSGSTCWRRLVRWQRAGVWRRLQGVFLSELRRRGRLDLRWAIVDSASLRALRGGKKLDRTLPIAARTARNITSSSTRAEFRS
jgi:transposase